MAARVVPIRPVQGADDNVHPRRVTDVDVHISQRVRARRQLIGMTQSDLAERLGVAPQQVQKYENGTSRIGAARLHNISVVLGVDVGFFFKGIGQSQAATDKFDPFAHEIAKLLRGQDDATKSRVLEIIKACLG